MSFLLAEKLNLALAKKSSSPEKKFYQNDDDKNIEKKKIMYKIDNYETCKGVEKMQKKLFEIKGRINEILSNVDILPTVEREDNKTERTSKGSLFQITSDTLSGTHGDEKKCQSEIFETLLEIYDETAKTRDDLMNEIHQKLNSMEDSLGSQSDANLFNKKMRRREKEATKAFRETMSVVSKFMEDFKKFQEMTSKLFESEDIPVTKSKFTPPTKAILLEKLQQANHTLKNLDKDQSRVEFLKSFYLPKNFPPDLATLRNEIENGFEDERRILFEMTKNWLDVCREIRETLIIVHENKLMKRETKLLIRKALFLHKKVVELLGMRNKELQTKEQRITELKSNIGVLTNKAGHLHNEVAHAKEITTTLKEKNQNLHRDKKELETHIERLEEESFKKNKSIEDLQFKLKRQVISASATLTSRMEHMVDEKRLNEEITKVKRVKEIEENQAALLAEMDKEVKQLKAQLKEETTNSKLALTEQIKLLEGKLSKSTTEVDSLKKIIEKIKSHRNSMTLQLAQKGKELSWSKLTLKRKQDLVENLQSTKVDFDAIAKEQKDSAEWQSDQILINRRLKSQRRNAILINKQTQSDPNFEVSDNLNIIDGINSLQTSHSDQIHRSTLNEVNNSELEIKKILEEKRDLRLEKEKLQEMLEDLKERHYQEIEILNKQMKQEILIEQEKSTSLMSTMYAEFLRIEIAVNRFRCRIVDLFERNRLLEASKEAVTSYQYSSPVEPENYIKSVSTATTRLQSGFNSLFESIYIAVKTAVQSYQQMKNTLEEKMKEKTSNIMKCLNDEQNKMRDLENQFEDSKLLAEKLKRERDKLQVEIEELGKQQVDSVTEKKKLLDKIKALYEEIKIEKTRGMDKKELRELQKTNENLEKHLQKAIKKLEEKKKEFTEKMESFAETKKNEKHFKEFLFYEQNRASINFPKSPQLQQHTDAENYCAKQQFSQSPLSMKQPEKEAEEQTKASWNRVVYKQHLISPESTNGRFVKILERISDCPKAFRNSKISNPHLIERIRSATNDWKKLTSSRFALLIVNYLKYSKYKNAADITGNEILSLQEDIFIKKSYSEDEKFLNKDFKIYQTTNKNEELLILEKLYWKLQSHIKTLLGKQVSKNFLEKKQLSIKNLRNITKVVQNLAKQGLQQKNKVNKSKSFQEAMHLLKELTFLLKEEKSMPLDVLVDDIPPEAKLSDDEENGSLSHSKEKQKWKTNTRKFFRINRKKTIKDKYSRPKSSDSSSTGPEIKARPPSPESKITNPPNKSSIRMFEKTFIPNEKATNELPDILRQPITFGRSNKSDVCVQSRTPISVTRINLKKSCTEKSLWQCEDNQPLLWKSEDAFIAALSGVTNSSTAHLSTSEHLYEFPKVVELDVRQDLRLIRKVLQKKVKINAESDVEISSRLPTDSPSAKAFQITKQGLKLRQHCLPFNNPRIKEKHVFNAETTTEELLSKLKIQYLSNLKRFEINRLENENKVKQNDNVIKLEKEGAKNKLQRESTRHHFLTRKGFFETSTSKFSENESNQSLCSELSFNTNGESLFPTTRTRAVSSTDSSSSSEL